MTVFASLLTLLALSGPAPMSARSAVAPPDSVGQEMRGSQRFLKHRVAAGETLFGLARRYKVTVDQLTAANPQLKNGLAVGQVVAVPRPAAGKAPAAPAAKTPTTAAKTTAPTASGTHTVVKGETLFSIARRYNMSPAELAKLNSLSTDAGVRLGQKLVVSGDDAGDNTPTPAVTYQPKATPEPKAPAPDPAKPAQIATVTPATPAEKAAEKEAEKEEDRSPTRASEVVTRVTENGMGAPIDKSVTDKYLALHKTAPVGTIMQVKNAGNGQSVYVRVIGKLPDTGENNSILVRLSPRAMQKLGTADSKFRVETSYVP
ncbi:LysM peptidoglycan-binding domain-containing protein [Hymenobacter sp. ASUV-10]|uniref:LysM peptidoglycan-binding domain-containing protein n=1 Tax=Hymenobacter aranciens TaxID=3063996 RepID=A0ABT9B7N9_9BACT|nr:LysM peptidoglycan-binding domain-containing protein [Hymenobacter sp. ASUV-10]MDO7874294.1 LysM peptidoglycan-binding domain-containing protein [Hymenobacter sp. ASUV-10]